MLPINRTYSLKLHPLGKYYICWTDTKGKSQRKSTRTNDLKTAEKLLAEMEATGKFNRSQSVYLVRDCLRRYWRGHVTHNVVDVQRIKTILRWVDEDMGSYLVSSITDEHINDYISHRAAGKVGSRPAMLSTIRRELSCFRTALNYCVAQRMVTRDEIPHIPLPKIPKDKAFWLSEDQVDKLMKSIAWKYKSTGAYSRVHLFILIGLSTGARKNAIEQLRWEHVDFEEGVIHFDKQVDIPTRKRKVAVPMSDMLVKVLKPLAPLPMTGFVLGTDAGIRHVFESFRKRMAKLHKDPTFLNMTPHTLRHTAATQMLRHGASLWQVAGLLGDSVETVANIYGHHVKDHLKEAVGLWKIGEKND